MNWWLITKSIHVSSALASISLFVLRGLWMMCGSPLLRRRWVRVVPHVIDTLLLGSAIVLAVITYQYPLVHGWLTAKVVALFVYIGLGMVALRFARSRPVKIGAWVAAVFVFAYIVAVAITRNPFPFTG
jgi:uncharacterized membrane protein SirB2